jgi:hypothetical protein
MLTKEDENFLKYWAQQRSRKKSFFGFVSAGLPLGVFIAVGLTASLIAASFHRKANPILHNYASLIITVMIAGLGILCFITYFSAQHKWEQNELHYQELLKKEKIDDVQQFNQ